MGNTKAGEHTQHVMISYRMDGIIHNLLYKESEIGDFGADVAEGIITDFKYIPLNESNAAKIDNAHKMLEALEEDAVMLWLKVAAIIQEMPEEGGHKSLLNAALEAHKEGIQSAIKAAKGE